MFGLSLSLPSLGNGPLRGSPRLRLQEGSRWRLMGRLYASGAWTSPRPGTLGAFAPSTALSHNRVRPLCGPYATQSETPKESVAPCPRELTGENSPLYTYQPTKMKTDRVLVKYFCIWYPNACNKCLQAGCVTHSRSDATHGRKRLSCSGVPLPDVWAMRRSRSSRRWMRCRIATTEWPLRRASSGQEMPSSLN